MAKTTDQLLEGIKRRIAMPSNQALYDDDDILAISDNVIETDLTPLILSLNQNFFLTDEDEVTTANVAAMSIPYRAIGRTLRDLKISNDGGTTFTNLNLVPVEDEHYFSHTGQPEAFYFKGDKFVLLRTPDSAAYTIRKFYDLAHSKLVTTTSCAVVSSSTSTTVDVSSLPSTIETGTTVDFIQGTSGNSLKSMDKVVQNAAGTTLTFTSGDIPTDLVAGDYIAVRQTTPVLMLPNEVYGLLETMTCRKILNGLSDYEAAAELAKEESDQMKSVRSMLEPRIKGENTVILNRNGLLRGGRRGFRNARFRTTV